MLAGIINAALERSGVSDRVDHRTLSEQGIDREATKHKGVVAVNMERRGKIAERAAIEHDTGTRQSEIEAVAGELAKLEKEERAEVRRADGRSRLEQRQARLEQQRKHLAFEKMAAEGAVRVRELREREAAEARARAKAIEEQAQREAAQRAREVAAQERRRSGQDRGGFSR
jgi:hypothetical protein